MSKENGSRKGFADPTQLEEFFVNYHELSGKKYRVLAVKEPNQVRKLVKSGMRATKN